MKTLCIIMILFVSISLKAQNTVNLNDNRVFKGQVKEINNNYLIITTLKSPQALILKDELINQTNDSTTLTFKMLNVNSFDMGQGLVFVENLFNTPGDELIKASKAFYTGIIITTSGLIVAGSSVYTNQPKEGDSEEEINKKLKSQKIIFGVGCGIVLIGTIIELTSFSHIAKAGKKFNVIMNKEGLGLNYRF
jgi:hypothetical protein